MENNSIPTERNSSGSTSNPTDHVDVGEAAEKTAEPTRKTKRERFLDMAEKRTQAVLDKLQVLGNCGNTATYEYEDSEVARIFAAIDEEVARTKAKFERRRKTNFRLR